MSYSNACSFAQANSLQKQIIFVNPDNIAGYTSAGYSSVGGGGAHAVVITGTNKDANGNTISYNAFDPQNNIAVTITLSESGQNNGSYWVY